MDLKSIARAPPPAFLFPNQQCQRPEPPPSLGEPAPPFSARCRRRRLSSEPRIPCQIVFFKTFRPHRQPTRRSSAEPAASKETTETSQAVFSKEKQTLPGRNTQETLAELFNISWRAASNEATQVSQAIISKKLRSHYLSNPTSRR